MPALMPRRCGVVMMRHITLSLRSRHSAYSINEKMLKRDRLVLRSFAGNVNDDKGDCSKSGSDGSMVYFHISPSGDWWTGPSIFAAKHLQPDYVKSIPMPQGFNPHAYFGEEEDDSEDYAGINNSLDNMSQQQQSKQQSKKSMQQNKQQKVELSWEEKQQLLFDIYDKEEIPSKLIN